MTEKSEINYLKMNNSQNLPKIGQGLFGYDEIEAHLLKNFHNNKLHHALLLSGHKGIGKANFAIKLAAKIISSTSSSQRKLGSDELNEIQAFAGMTYNINDPSTDNINDLSKINSYHNPNLLIIRREIGSKQELKRDISVDSIRKIIDFTSLTSSSSKYRVIIIDTADEMNRNSANALLKILEEPPSNVFLFLISHNSNSLPITIRSRCNLIKINPLSFENFKKSLAQIDPEILPSQIKNLFILSGGSVSLALEFHSHNAIELYEKILASNLDKSSNSSIIEKITNKDFSWEIFEQIIIFYLNRLTKVNSGVKIENYISELEAKNLISKSKNNLDNIFSNNEKIIKLLADTKSLNLDKRQSAINIFNLWVK